MGMFDRIDIDEALLPIIDHKELLEIRNEELQTKDLSNTLELYKINSCGCFNREGERQEVKSIVFYCYTDSEKWYEFEAFFKEDNTLKEIILIKKEI